MNKLILIELRLHRAQIRTRPTRPTRPRLFSSSAIQTEPEHERGKSSTAFDADCLFLVVRVKIWSLVIIIGIMAQAESDTGEITALYLYTQQRFVYKSHNCQSSFLSNSLPNIYLFDCLFLSFSALSNKTGFFATSKIKTYVSSIVSESAIPHKQIFGNDAREVVQADWLIQLDSKKAAVAF